MTRQIVFIISRYDSKVICWCECARTRTETHVIAGSTWGKYMFHFMPGRVRQTSNAWTFAVGCRCGTDCPPWCYKNHPTPKALASKVFYNAGGLLWVSRRPQPLRRVTTVLKWGTLGNVTFVYTFLTSVNIIAWTSILSLLQRNLII